MFTQKSNYRREPREYDQKLLGLARVARVVAGGKRFRFRAAVVVGNRKGKVGFGLGKGQDVALAMGKAAAEAERNLTEVVIVKGTIPYSVSAKYKSARIMLKPGVEGKGIVAGGAVRAVCELAGISNISGKIISRTKNQTNNAKATLLALKKIKKSNQYAAPSIEPGAQK